MPAAEAKKEEGNRNGEAKGRKRKEAFIYGNYRNYYTYRIDSTVMEDPRLAVLKREWFEGKDCLDIGCNQGLITIGIAKKFLCQSILGIDIDAGLIETAYWNLRKINRVENLNKKTEGDSNHSNCLEGSVSQISNGKALNSKHEASRTEGNLFKIVSFHCENFVESLQECTQKYDTIMCLSVTKWIHLNWGDDGIINLFAKIWKLLRPGGLLLLEPQPWTSYKRNRLVSETAKANFQNILLRPHKFQEILLDKVGFRSADAITDSLSGTVAGFDRPIVAYCK